jgi:hypothetical protein
MAVDSDGDASVTDGFLKIYIDDQVMYMYATDAAVSLDGQAPVFNLGNNKIQWTYVAATTSVASPELPLYDSGAAGTERADEWAAALNADFTTATEDDEIADVWISVMADDGDTDQDAAEVTIFEWDGSDYSITLGDPVGDQAAEDLKFDFSTGTANEINVTSNTGVTDIDFGSINIGVGNITAASTTDPAFALYDSDADGAERTDEFAGAFLANFDVTTEDAEDSTVSITFMLAGTETTGLTIGGTTPVVSSGAVPLVGAVGITTDSDGHSVATNEAYGYLIVETGNQQTVTLPSAVLGMNICVLADGADGSAEVYVDCDAGDHFEYNGTSMANGEYIYNSSDEKGDYMCFAAIDTSTWVLVGYRGTVAEESP